MSENLSDNPFLGLFSTVNDALLFSQLPASAVEKKPETNVVVSDEVKDLAARVFGLALTRENDPKESLVFIDSDSLEHAVFERILLANANDELVKSKKNPNVDSHVVQNEVISYLFEAFGRLQLYRKNEESERARKIIFRNASTALQETELFEGQEVFNQFMTLFMENYDENLMTEFMDGLVGVALLEKEDLAQNVIRRMFEPILRTIQKEAFNSDVLTFKGHWFLPLQIFSKNIHLGKFLIKYTFPAMNMGKAYEHTVLGTLLSISCLRKNANDSYDMFDLFANSQIELNITNGVNSLITSLHKIFYNLLKNTPEVQHLTLLWIGNCLHDNAPRGKLWNAQNEAQFGATTVSDGFMLNLNSVLLKLCKPFTSKPEAFKSKITKIDPTYCVVEVENQEESRERKVHLRGLHTETCLIPTPEGESRPKADSFNFISECFFMAHRAYSLGHLAVIDKFIRQGHHLGRLQALLNEQRASGHAMVEVLAENFRKEERKYIALKVSLLPEMNDDLEVFHTATAIWLMQVYLNDEPTKENGKVNYAPKELKKISFPLPDNVPDTVRCVPEFIIENVVGFMCFVRSVSPSLYEKFGPTFMNPILTLIIALMESSTRLYNPHLRAKLAEGLEALLPNHEEMQASPIPMPPTVTFQREQLFLNHPHKQQIVVSLLNVFVSIEMTGQSVQFEQKFNYRRPMYIIMKYLWKIQDHCQVFKNLEKEAEANMEAVQPPLFLRFINLLINDAVFLLDEALSNMSQLRKILTDMESEEWSRLSPEEQHEQTAQTQYIGHMARFDNILGRDTIGTLNMLTTEIKSIFCHPTMVDRIASMLNYLLLQLVGPNKNKLKVKDHKKYEFNPAQLVLNICQIYINLSGSEAFTLAVSQDGRSYSSQLFKQAIDVLIRIDGMNILNDLEVFSSAVEKAALYKKEEDEILADAPDDFLDPLVQTLLMDPVLLPSSRVTVDRQTIARHLLSDQTDPFNRSPLTMNMVVPNVELRNKIQEWIAQKKQEKASTSDTSTQQ